MIKLHDLQITGLVLTCFIRDHLQHYAQGQNLLWFCRHQHLTRSTCYTPEAEGLPKSPCSLLTVDSLTCTSCQITGVKFIQNKQHPRKPPFFVYGVHIYHEGVGRMWKRH